MSRTIWKRTIFMALAAGSLLVGRSEAQEGTWVYRASPPGWVGISVNYEWSWADGEERTLVTINNVVEGSPAQEQGLRVGDTITFIDGRPVSQQAFAHLRETLAPGDLVRMVVLRDGREQEFLIEAGVNPSRTPMPTADIDQLLIALDTLRGAIWKDLESLTVSIAGLHLEEDEGEVSVKLLRVPSRETEAGTRGTIFRFPEAMSDTLSVGGEAFVLDPGFAMPFQAFFVQSEATDSLRTAMAELRKQLTDVRRRELMRQRQLMASIQAPPKEYLAADELIRELRAQETELVERQEELSRELTEVLEVESRRQWAEASTRSREAFDRTQWTRERVREVEEAASSQRERASREQEREQLYQYELQYRTPQIWGQNYVLGAELNPLNPEIAGFFSVDEGVVVWEVPEGTPAAEFGFRVGDVIVEVGGAKIRSIGDLRQSLEAVGRPVTVHLVRRGEPEPVEVVIRR